MKNINVATGVHIFQQHFSNTGEHFAEKTAHILKNSPFNDIEINVPLSKNNSVSIQVIEEHITEWKLQLDKFDIHISGIYIADPLHLGILSQEKDMSQVAVDLIHHLIPELKFITINPEPIDWSNPNKTKSYNELQVQLKESKYLSSLCAKYNTKLCYHFHTSELVENAREFEFMVSNTSNDELAINFDASWWYRAGYKTEYFLDKYLPRINIVHLRSSHNEQWDELLNNGDENLQLMLHRLWDSGFQGLHVIELADDDGVTYKHTLPDRLNHSYNILNTWREEYISSLLA